MLDAETPLVTATIADRILTVTNYSSQSVLAWKIGTAGSIGSMAEICQPSILPGRSATYALTARLASIEPQLDAVLRADGSILGPNTWGVGKYYGLWQQVMSGGPAYPSGDHFAWAGDSLTFARGWARQFQDRHGDAPQIVPPASFIQRPRARSAIIKP